MSGRHFLRPLLPLPIAFAAGILIGECLPPSVSYLWGAAGLCLLWRLRNIAAGAAAVIPLLVLFLLLGCLAIQPWVSPRFPAHHVIHAAGRFCKEIRGTILTPPKQRGERFSCIMAVDALDGSAERATGRIRVSSGDEGIPDLRQGDRIRFSGRIRRIRSLKNPGGFDYARFMAFQRVHCSAYVRKGSLALLDERKPQIPDRLSAFRRRIQTRISEECPGAAGDILTALLIGEKRDLSPDVRKRFNRAGIGHLLAISGLHIGSIMALCYGVFRWLLAFVTPLLWHGWLRKTAAAASLIPVVAYAALAQWSPSTQRAVCMAAAVCLSLWVERETDLMNSIALAALVILAIFPPALFSISFQLSFAAVITIAAGMSVMFPKKSADDRRSLSMKGKLLSFTAVSFLAVIGTLPLSMLYFNQVSFIGIAANLVYIPLVGFFVLPLGLTSMAVFPVSASFSGMGFMLCGKLLDTGLAVLPLFSEFPFGSFATLTPTAFEIGLYYAAGGMLLLLRDRASKHAGSNPMRPVRLGKKTVVAAWILILVAASGDVLFWTHDRFFRDDLRITVIDVGQGSAALVEFPQGYRMLIDGGGYYDRRIFDVGASVVAPFLRRRRIFTLDAVVLSHPDSDHMNGLFAVVEQFRVKALWTGGSASGNENYEMFIDLAEKKGIFIPPFEDLPRRWRINGADVEILYPSAEFRRGERKRGPQEKWRRKSNNRSVVIAARLGGIGVLFPGDIETPAECDLLKECGGRLRHRVLVAPHHGSRTSSSTDFLKSVSPEYVLVSAGRQNRFHCPHPDVLARYREVGALVLRTDTDGALQLTTDGRKLNVGPAVVSFRSVLAGRIHDVFQRLLPCEPPVVFQK